MNFSVLDVDELMSRAVAYSQRHVEAGGLPFVGQVITADAQVSDYGVNRVLETGDPTAHAEIVAMRAVARDRGMNALDGAMLLATGEPCALCYRFASDHKIAGVRFAVDRDTAAMWGFDYREGYAALSGLPVAQTWKHCPVSNGLEPFITYQRLRLRYTQQPERTSLCIGFISRSLSFLR